MEASRESGSGGAEAVSALRELKGGRGKGLMGRNHPSVAWAAKGIRLVGCWAVPRARLVCEKAAALGGRS